VHRNVTSYTISKQVYVVHYMNAFHAEVAASLGLAASYGVYGSGLWVQVISTDTVEIRTSNSINKRGTIIDVSRWVGSNFISTKTIDQRIEMHRGRISPRNPTLGSKLWELRKQMMK
jgi:hypothetical protein